MDKADIEAIKILAEAWKQVPYPNGYRPRQKLSHAIQSLRNRANYSKNRTYRSNRPEIKNLWNS